MRKTTKKNIYYIPDFSVKEIIQYYSEMQIQLKPSELLNPTPLSTQKLFETFLQIYKGEKVSESVERIIRNTNNSIYEESLYLVFLLKKLSSFFEKINYDGFSSKDILQPDSKRIISLISHIMNFSMYRDNKRHVYEKIIRKGLEREEIKQDIENKIRMQENILLSQEDELKRNKKVLEGLKEEIECLEKDLKEFFKQQRQKANEVEILKQKKSEISDKISSTQLIVVNYKQEIASLKTQIVNDPKKLLELLKEMKTMILKEKDSIKFLESRYNKLKEKINNFEDSISDLRRILKTAVQIQNFKKDKEKIIKENMILESESKNVSSYMDSLDNKYSHIIKQISHLETKINNLQENDNSYFYGITSRMEDLKINYDQISESRNETYSKIEVNNKKIKEYEQESLKLKENHENEMMSFQSALCGIKDKIYNYLNELNAYLKN
ncbi:putative kinetochore protein Nuf2 [Hamiltosporidium tvaerminnensis]|uniref:Putative kinetochore protein Nuf2 n=2 Tax=Hamiltosporidium TaxID=1176354 RepID=A0A4Q9L1V9_9MICR|nr:putative kinetochore protein Nuf2 [Hamiltosporidium tvaerminnensis]TBU01368.1 putative kinetochore protein Nuf2 [Hamiltosporidium magnivora]